jgi:MFS family permease
MLGEYRGIPWQAQLLVYLSVVPSVAIGFLYADVSFYLTTVQHVDPSWMGATISTMGIAVVATSIPLGALADRYGRRRMLILGNVSAAASLVGFAFTSNVGLLILFAAVEGAGEAAFAVAFSALIADSAGDAKRTAAFSLGFFLNWAGEAAGAFSIYSVVFVSHFLLFVIMGLMNLAVTPLIFRVEETKVIKEKKEKMLSKKSRGILLRFGVYGVCIASGAGLFVPLMTLWFNKMYGVNDAISGPMLGFASLVTAMAILLAPKLAKKLGIVKAIVATQAPATLCMLAVPLSPIFVISGFVYTVRVFLMNLSNPLGQSLLMGLVSPEERSSASGIIASIFRLPNALSVSLGSVLIGAGLLALPFYIASVLYTVAITLFWLAFRKARLPEEETNS